jgi:allantoin racemase
VIDGVGAAVRLAEAVVGLGLTTSKVSTYAFPDPKKIIAWPLSSALGLADTPAGADGASGKPARELREAGK